MSKPIKNLAFNGITFKDTRYTYLDPHGMPSGGDWGLQRSAAVFVQNAEDIQIRNCLFSRLDGNALMLSGYNRKNGFMRCFNLLVLTGKCTTRQVKHFA